MSSYLHVRVLARYFTLVFAVFVFNQCDDVCSQTDDYVYYEAVYTPLDEFRASVASVDPQPLNSPGKIYWKDNYLYISEPGRGIHVINNVDPSNPQPVSFISIPGSFDLAIRNNILYTDSYIDLVAIDISVPGQEQEVSRVQNVFQANSIDGFMYDATRGIVTDWKKTSSRRVEESDCSYQYSVYGPFTVDGIFVNTALESSFRADAKFASVGGGSTTGVGGSFARFAITGDYLYALNKNRLEVLSIPEPQHIQLKTPLELGWDIETIFPLGQNLFIGSQTGMHILDIQKPDAPVRMSTYTHLRACDPVVVEDGYAYVTLRNGSQCQNFTNQLEVIDISDLRSPVLVKSYPMTNPHGLGIDDGTLFICDGKDGLKIFDTTDKLAVDKNQLAHYKDIHAFDIIPFNKVAMMIGDGGLYQYDYSNLQDIRLLSLIQVNPAE